MITTIPFAPPAAPFTPPATRKPPAEAASDAPPFAGELERRLQSEARPRRSAAQDQPTDAQPTRPDDAEHTDSADTTTDDITADAAEDVASDPQPDGEPIDADRHDLRSEIKAVTWHDLAVQDDAQGHLEARVLFDL